MRAEPHQAAVADRGDAQLWLAAFGISVLMNLGFLVLLVYGGIQLLMTPGETPPPPEKSEAAADRDRILTIAPSLATIEEMNREEDKKPVAAEPLSAVRTSEDQRAERPERPLFIGERDTRTRSERAPVEGAPPLPSQAGIEPRHEGEIETTESEYQDGLLPEELVDASEPVEDAEESPAPEPQDQETAQATEAIEAAETLAREAAEAGLPPLPTPPQDRLIEGPNPVEVPVPIDPPVEETVAERAEEAPAGEAPKTAEPQEEELAEETKPAEQTRPPKPTNEPGFRGNQRRTAIRGSISRTGRSSLDVADTPLGRYQAQISRAVEKEWQLNCVRNRDFIMPGFLTVRFFVESSGRVRSVQFVGEMETGEIQKGFTLNSIRNAPIPPMPAGLREEYADDPLELIFNFYF